MKAHRYPQFVSFVSESLETEENRKEVLAKREFLSMYIWNIDIFTSNEDQ